jgi:hypothetical protein
MRVGDRDPGDAAKSLNPGNGIAIDEANAVPKNVTGAMLNQESALADSELGFSPDAPNSWAFRV